MNFESPTRMHVKISISVESAKTAGKLRECFVIELTYVGNVFVPAPFTKLVITTSSIDNVNAKSPPAIMPGNKIGNVT